MLRNFLHSSMNAKVDKRTSASAGLLEHSSMNAKVDRRTSLPADLLVHSSMNAKINKRTSLSADLLVHSSMNAKINKRISLSALLMVVLVVAALMLGACKQNPGIIKYDTGMNNLKQEPRDTSKEDKQAAAQTHTQLAAVYMGQGHLKEAQQALEKALNFDRSYIPAHTMLAILDWRIHRLDDADREFRAAIALDPGHGDTNNNYGKFLCEHDRGGGQHQRRSVPDAQPRLHRRRGLSAQGAGSGPELPRRAAGDGPGDVQPGRRIPCARLPATLRGRRTGHARFAAARLRNRNPSG